MSWVAGGFAAAICAGAPVLANPFEGEWCHPVGAIMFLEAQQLGFNDHTICSIENTVTPEPNADWTSPITCRHVYIRGINPDGSMERLETPMHRPSTITLRPVAPDQIAVDLGSAAPPAIYHRCE
ncbi:MULTISPECIES: hypothetical protein [Paracoccaceae]|jgi:hypothetical protein|uniref:hypothetical protein n=1 Tax=Rhodobacterales TaxID=204455 RepID=UPI001B0FF8FD|nr:hypothetical protein [Boseongicola sp. H5]MBO6604208.1 hypothetical protein [Roseicyclus sp.]MBO6626506.1 hypothetical protein [Roseicyclus sp.]MBO6923592.1 hypothetical protein [Roseicyclus sp.]